MNKRDNTLFYKSRKKCQSNYDLSYNYNDTKYIYEKNCIHRI